MNVLEVPFALFAFCGIVAVVPVWMYYVETYASGLQPEARFLAQFAMPAILLLFIASWFQPGG
jgi:hypothetical protein